MDLTKIDNIEFDGVNYADYPDFSDAFVSSADYDGREMTEEELNVLNGEHSDFVYEELLFYLF